MNRFRRLLAEIPPLGEQPHGEILRFCTLGGFKVLSRHSHPEVGFCPEIIEYITDQVDRIRNEANFRLTESDRERLLMHSYVCNVTDTPAVDEVSDMVRTYEKRFRFFTKQLPRDREVDSIHRIVDALNAVEQYGETRRIEDAKFLYAKQAYRRQINPDTNDDSSTQQ